MSGVSDDKVKAEELLLELPVDYIGTGTSDSAVAEERWAIEAVVQAFAAVRAEQREENAKIAETSRWAPVDYGGMCLECREWAPTPNHSNRGEHLESCSWAEREFRASKRIATAIRKEE